MPGAAPGGRGGLNRSRPVPGLCPDGVTPEGLTPDPAEAEGYGGQKRRLQPGERKGVSLGGEIPTDSCMGAFRHAWCVCVCVCVEGCFNNTENSQSNLNTSAGSAQRGRPTDPPAPTARVGLCSARKGPKDGEFVSLWTGGEGGWKAAPGEPRSNPASYYYREAEIHRIHQRSRWWSGETCQHRFRDKM